MRLPDLLIVVSLVIFGIGLRRAFRHPTHGAVSKTTLLVWLVLFLGSFLVWNWASHRASAQPFTLNVRTISAPPLW